MALRRAGRVSRASRRPNARCAPASANVAQHLAGILRQFRQVAARRDDADWDGQRRPHDRIDGELAAREFVLHGGGGEDRVAEAALDHRLGESHAVGLDHHAQPQAVFERGILHQTAVGVRAVGQDQRQRAEVADAEALRMRLLLDAMLRWADDEHALGQERSDFQRFEVRRIVQQREIDALFQEPFLQRRCDALAHVQRRLGPCLAESFDEVGHDEPPGRRRHAEHEAAARRRTVLADLLARLLHELGDRLGALEQARAGGGKPHAAAVPRE